MVSALDILYKIACSLYGYTDLDPAAAIDELIARHRGDCRLTITDDVEVSEFIFLSQYGPGDTFYFTIKDADEGKAIIHDLQTLFTGFVPEGSRFPNGSHPPYALLYLFVHIRKHRTRHPLAFIDDVAMN